MPDKDFTAGDVLTAADVDTYLSHTGNAYNTWTPAVTQSGSVSATVNHATYFRAGRFIHWAMSLSITGSGSSGNSITVTLPVTAARSGQHVGFGNVNDASDAATGDRAAFAVTNSTTTMIFRHTNQTAPSTYIGASYGLASGDSINMSGVYEAAS